MSKRPYEVGDQPIPGYRLEQFLGRGGFGEVWRAVGPGGTRVALKIIKSLSSAQGRKELRSLRIIKRIQHAHLVPIAGVWLKDESGTLLDDSLADRDDLLASRPASEIAKESWAVNPLRSGTVELLIAMGLGHKSLFECLHEYRDQGLEGIPADVLLDYMHQAALAIDYLNSASHQLDTELVSVQHCDIKPQNILLVGTAVQVCDFGLARSSSDVRATATTAGSAAYAAPECLREGGRPSESTDQYSLAITYYELRTGALPYRDESLLEVMRATLQGELDLSRLSPAEQAVIRRATQLDPAARFSSGRDMVKALRLAVEQPNLAPGDFRDATRQSAKLDPSTGHTAKAKVAVPFLLLCVLAGFGWWGYQKAQQMDKLREQKDSPDPIEATAAASGGNRATSIAEYDKIIERAPNNARALTGRGELHLQAKAFDEAIADFESARRADAVHYQAQQSEARAHFERGERRLQAADFEGAVDDFAAAGQLDDKHYADRAEPAAALIGRGRSLLKQQQPERALTSLEAAIEQYPQHAAPAYLQRGQCRLALGDRDGALADFNRAVDVEADRAAGLWARGQLLAKEKDYAHAIDDLEQARRIDPDLLAEVAGRKALAESYLQRGQSEVNVDRLAQAIADFDRARKLDGDGTLGYQKHPEYVDAYLKQGALLRDQKEFASAAEALKTATEQDPQSALAFSRLGYVQLKQRQYSESIQNLSKAIELDPNDLDVFNRAIAYSSAGKTDDALREFTALLDRDPNDADVRFQRALAYLDNSQYDAANADLRAALAVAPENIDAAAQLALVIAGSEHPSETDLAEALQLAKQACVASDWKSAAHLDALAAANAASGKLREAVKWASKAVEQATADTDPEDRAAYVARLKLYEAGQPYHLPAPK